MNTPKTWIEAVAYCEAINSILIEPRNKALNNLAKSFKNKAWIGASDIDVEGTFVWKSNGESLTYKDWAPDQPNNDNAEQHCVAIQGNDQWGDFDCTAHTREFICQAEKGKSYMMFP